MDWQTITFAPRAFDVIIPAGHGIEQIKFGRAIKVRGTHGDQTEEFVGQWSQYGEGCPYWFDVEGQEPIDWPITEWRELTPEEDAAVHPDCDE